MCITAHREANGIQTPPQKKQKKTPTVVLFMSHLIIKLLQSVALQKKLLVASEMCDYILMRG